MFPEDSAGRAGIGNEVPHLGRRKFRRIIPVGVERLPVHMGRNWESGPRKAGWGDVLKQERRVVARSRTYFGRVANDEGGGQPSVKGFYFILAVRGIGHSRPHGAVSVPASDFSQRACGEGSLLVFIVLGHFRGCAIV